MVAILAVWGESVRHWLSGPRLEIRLESTLGEATVVEEGVPARYYHIFVANLRPHAPAMRTKVMLKGHYTDGPGGKFIRSQLKSPLQFAYQYKHLREYHDMLPTVGSSVLCDIGYLKKGDSFLITTYIAPNNFYRKVDAGRSILMRIRAEADNATLLC
jgi:hypothetical protein